ncbi:flagellar hook-basal body complex protein FliE [Virgibacillus kimchii]
MIHSINNSSQYTSPISNKIKPEITPGEAQKNFANTLKQSIENVNEAQQASDRKTEALIRGEINDLHDVMITAQKASITLETAVQVQQKALDAYNEVMRMQI